MTDASVQPDVADEGTVSTVSDAEYTESIIVELGNLQPHDNNQGVRTEGIGPTVARLVIPQGKDRYGNDLYSFPDEHDDDLLPERLATRLRGVSDENKAEFRRLLVNEHLSHPSRVNGLHNHAAAVSVIHPLDGFWQAIAAPGSTPSFARSNHPGMEKFLAEHYDAPQGYPSNLEDMYWTRHASGVYPPGAIPPQAADVVMGHTTYGRLNQALVMGGFTATPTAAGTSGTATAATATTLAGSAEAGAPTHTLNDCAGQWLVVSANASGTGSKVYGLIMSNTTGTTPTYTVDQWYNANAPGGAVGTTPNATSLYQVLGGGPAAIFVALSSDTTAFSLGGAGGTADAATITQTLTGELAVAGSGLLRKIAPIGQSSATWTATPVYTATASDQSAGAQTVNKAAYSPSIVRTAGVLLYMTIVTPSATLTATGDQLTLTWTWTMS